jgi:menaquinone-dependent protoporphyrinogen oxidase
VFAVCITEAMWGGRSHDAVVRWMQPIRDLVQPVSEGYFAGVLDLSKVPSRAERQKFRIGIALGAFSEGDHRDWEAIQAWANDLPVKLKLVASRS